MAINPIPRSSFELQFGVLDTMDQSRGLLPAFIAPRYVVHGTDGVTESADNGYIGTYGEASGTVVNWPGRAEVDSTVDTAKAAVYAPAPVVTVNHEALSATTESTALNKLTFEETVAAGNGETADVKLNGYSVVAGDKLKITKGGSGERVVTVVDVQASLDPAVVGNAEELTSNTGSGALTTSGTFIGTEECIYLVRVAEISEETEVSGASGASGAAGQDISSIKFEVTAIGGEVGYSATLTFTEASVAQNIGNYGAKMAVDAMTGFALNDSYVITCSPSQAGARNIVYVNATLDAGWASQDLEVFVESGNVIGTSVEIAKAYVNTTATGVQMMEDAYVQFGGVSYALTADTKLFVSYRELLKSDTYKLLDVRTGGAADWVGQIVPDNPLGMMYGVANSIAPGSFYLMAVPDSSDESYQTALEYIGTFEEVFAPIPYDQNRVIQSTLVGIVNKYSDPYIAQYKKAWLTALTKESSVVYEKTSNGMPLLGTVTDSVLTLEAPADVVAGGLKIGDTAILMNVYDESLEAYIDREYEITSIVDSTSVGLSGAVDTGRVAQVKFTRELSTSEYAAALAAEARAYNNAWVNLVWCDSLTVLGYSNQPLSLLCCALAALRASLPPHAPLSDVTVPSVEVGNTLMLSDAEYETLNTGGVWVVRPDATGSPVTMHQITTLTDGTIAEEDSVVSNGASIAHELRSATKKFRGNVNVSDDLIEQLRADILAVFAQIAGRSYSAIYGPQLEDYEIVELKRDDANKQRLLCKLSGAMPLPLIDSESVFALN